MSMELHCDEKRADNVINQPKIKATATSSSNISTSIATEDLTNYLNPLGSTGSAITWPNAVEHCYIAKTVTHGSSPENGYESSLGPIPTVRAPIPVSIELQAHRKCERFTSIEIDSIRIDSTRIDRPASESVAHEELNTHAIGKAACGMGMATTTAGENDQRARIIEAHGD